MGVVDANSPNPVYVSICDDENNCISKMRFPEGTNFPKSSTRTFSESIDCFEISLSKITLVKLEKQGKDRWYPEYVKIVVNNRKSFTCLINEWLEDSTWSITEKACTEGNSFLAMLMVIKHIFNRVYYQL